jgi:maltose phosphorylase
MKHYILHDEWNIIEEGFVAENNRVSESLFSIGNGHMGQRANFEEAYSGDTLRGSYIAGIYYPDKTRVGWWKNGYPEYFAKILNATNWIGINVTIEGESLNLDHCQVDSFARRLDMRNGVLIRSFRATTPGGKTVEVESQRFISITEPDAGVIKYSIRPINFSGNIHLEPYIDGNVTNEDSNYDEQFWQEVESKVVDYYGHIIAKTKKTRFHVCTAMQYQITLDNVVLQPEVQALEDFLYIANRIEFTVNSGQELTIYKFTATETSLNHEIDELAAVARSRTTEFLRAGFAKLLEDHSKAWHAKWEESDIIIEGDLAAQQAIRFNIFQLYQTYTGDDEHLNIGPKGFTGEKYGGVTYWDTEAFCLPFYLRTADQHVARNLLKYRHNHLAKAIENAKKLGFTNGAALYPMVTINGEECHNEWEITFEEIHRNGAIAYAIYNYVRYTGDTSYLGEFGLEVLIAIARFWAQRVNWSEARQKYVMLGVTGPNEYENNVNNNWYTSTLACWTMSYTMETLGYLRTNDVENLERVMAITNFDQQTEVAAWEDILDNMYLGEDRERGIFLQQDGFLDKALIPAGNLPPEETPIHENWSWDRILRSCYIKQADVLQGIYLFEERFDTSTIKSNFDFYEPLTVHESSLSACIHSILASRLGRKEKAYEMYLRTARLDLDDYNNDADDGLHITSMGGTWMSIVEGFAGLRIKDDQLSLNPTRPDNWSAYEFRIVFRGAKLNIRVNKTVIDIRNLSDHEISLFIYDQKQLLRANDKIKYKLQVETSTV